MSETEKMKMVAAAYRKTRNPGNSFRHNQSRITLHWRDMEEVVPLYLPASSIADPYPHSDSILSLPITDSGSFSSSEFIQVLNIFPGSARTIVLAKQHS